MGCPWKLESLGQLCWTVKAWGWSKEDSPGPMTELGRSRWEGVVFLIFSETPQHCTILSHKYT